MSHFESAPKSNDRRKTRMRSPRFRPGEYCRIRELCLGFEPKRCALAHWLKIETEKFDPNSPPSVGSLASLVDQVGLHQEDCGHRDYGPAFLKAKEIYSRMNTGKS